MAEKKLMRTTFAVCCLLFMILDSKNVIAGAANGVQLCLQVIIPSLLPYLILTNLLITTLSGTHAIFIAGILGGYPAGAQAVKTAYETQRITKIQAENMLAYCNHAGPAFIFGMLSQLFSATYIPWLIWGVHILSALAVYVIFSKKQNNHRPLVNNNKTYTLSDALASSVKSIALICGWVVLFRIILQIIDIRIFKQTGDITVGRAIIYGLLELSNGCIILKSICSEKLRFILSCGFLGFGGICVTFQTFSVANGLSCKKYVVAKLIQGVISTVLAAILTVFILK